jgi:hypothetical protein
VPFCPEHYCKINAARGGGRRTGPLCDPTRSAAAEEGFSGGGSVVA